MFVQGWDLYNDIIGNLGGYFGLSFTTIGEILMLIMELFVLWGIRIKRNARVVEHVETDGQERNDRPSIISLDDMDMDWDPRTQVQRDSDIPVFEYL